MSPRSLPHDRPRRLPLGLPLSRLATAAAVSLLAAPGWAQLSTADPAPASRNAASDDGATLPAVTVRGAAVTENDSTEGSGSYTPRSSRGAIGLDLSPRETPQSITVITRQQLDDQNLNDLNAVMAQTPGVSRGSYGDADSGYVTYYARGFEINNFQLDGVITSPLAMEGLSGIGTRDMAVYDHVVVVRGATGLLSGAGDPSASINLVRKRPTADFQASAGLSLGRWNRRRIEADVSTPFDAAGRTGGRLVVAHEDNDGWMRGAHARKTTVYGIVEAELAPRTSLRGGIDFGRVRTRHSSMHGFSYADTEGVPTRFTGFDNPSTRDSYLDLDRTSVFATLEHGFGEGWNLHVALNHTRVKADQLYGVAAWAVQAGSDASGVTYGRSVNTPRQNAFDLRVSGPFGLFGREHELVAGLNLYRAKQDDPSYPRQLFPLDSIYDFDGSVPAVPFVSTSRSTEDQRQTGAYLAARLRPSDGVAVIAGARVSNFKNENSWDDREDNGIVTPYLGLVVDLTPNWSPYASYTTTFNPQGGRDARGERLDPEEGSNLELGLKGSFADGRLNTSAAVFRTRKDNLAVADGDVLTPQGDQAYRAEDDTRARGFELDLNGEIAAGLQVGAGYTRVQIRDSDGGLLNTSVVPKHQFKLFGTWRPAALLQGLTLGAGAVAQSAVFENDAASNSPAELRQYRQGARTIVNLMAGYELTPRLRLGLNLDNAFDKRYRSNVSQHNIGTPRNLTASLRYRY